MQAAGTLVCHEIDVISWAATFDGKLRPGRRKVGIPREKNSCVPQVLQTPLQLKQFCLLKRPVIQ